MKNPDRLRVLVVDDDPSYRLLAKESLPGHVKWIAATAREGLELFRMHHPDICFLDLSLPDDNGLEMLLEMRDDMPEAYVVMLTSSRLTEDVALAQRCAANGYVTKPFSRRQLVEYCKNCVRHWSRLEEMDALERTAFRRQMREAVAQMQAQLHRPAADTQAALQQLMPHWRIMVTGQEGAADWAEHLRSAGYSVTHARTGEETLSLLQKQPHRLMLTEELLLDMEASDMLCRMPVRLPTILVVDAHWKPAQPKWQKLEVNRVIVSPLSSERLQVVIEKEITRSLHDVSDIMLSV